MKRRWIVFPLWLLPVIGLYFFENNAGTRAVLALSILVPALLFFLRKRESADRFNRNAVPEPIPDFPKSGVEEPDVVVREYRPGDPVRRIHWKLSAKMDRLLIRETTQAEEEHPDPQAGFEPSDESRLRPGEMEEAPEKARKEIAGRRGMRFCLLLMAAALALLFLLPEARNGAGALCNRLFEWSESVNPYVYERLSVPEGQGDAWAIALLAVIGAGWIALLLFSRSRALALVSAGLLAGFQIWFGVSFAAPVNLLLFAFFGWFLLPRPLSLRSLLICGTAAAGVLALVLLLWPGVDDATEAASEHVRDRLSQAVFQTAGGQAESAAIGPETRHVHTRTAVPGGAEAKSGKDYRRVAVEEEQISVPHWIDYLKIVLLLLLSVCVIVLPFLPFALLAARRKKEQKAREAFRSGEIREAICAMFDYIARWFRLTRRAPDNLLYRDWAPALAKEFPSEYTDLYLRCSRLFEEAAYSEHPMEEADREQVLSLVEETEKMLYARADRKLRFRLRYVECICE